MITTDLARMLTRYKAWANEIVFSTVAALPEGEATKPRPTLFKNMVHTLNHPYVIDRITPRSLGKCAYDKAAVLLAGIESAC